MYSPVSGKITEVHLVSSPWNSYVVIEDAATGVEFVLGHITGSVRKGASVTPSTKIGQIALAGTGAHLHLGVVWDFTTAFSPGSGWGFGRGPLKSSITVGTNRGWIDPRIFFP